MRTDKDCASNAAEIISGNIFIRPVKLAKAGEQVGGHTHNFDHTTIFLKGTVHIKVTDPSCGCVTECDRTAPGYLLIKADRIHELTALTDDVEFWCVYAHRDANRDVVQVAEGRAEAYV